MSEHDDYDEFLEASDNFLESVSGIKKHDDDHWERNSLYNKPSPKPGTPCQYQIFGSGYMPTPATIKALPPGVYDIAATPDGIFADPAPIQEGLLLKLPEMRSDYVLELVNRFWSCEKDYKEGNEYVQGGAMFKIGVLLFGPGGTGKSTTIKLLCKQIVSEGGLVFMGHTTSPSSLSSFLKDFSQIEPDRRIIVVLEDFDSMIGKYGDGEYLQLLDGSASIDNVLFIATTNYPDKLDPRIYNRPGRFTHVVKIDYPTEAARRAYLKAVLKKHDDVETIVSSSKGFSVDHLSALVNAVYREKKELMPEIERLRKLFKVPKIEEERTMGIK